MYLSHSPPADPTRVDGAHSPSTRPVRREVAVTAPSPASSPLVEGPARDLSNRFPIEARYPLQKSLKLALTSLCLFFGYFLAYGLEGFAGGSSLMIDAQYLVVRLSFLAFVMQYLYWEIWRRHVTYRVDGSRLLISKGLWVKVQGSLPLSPLTEIYVKRSFSDILFGLAQLHVVAPMDPSHDFGNIEGLSLRSARALQQILTEELHGDVWDPRPVATSRRSRRSAR